MAKEVTESAYDSVEPYFTPRKQDSIEQKKGGDPRTVKQLREPSCGNLAELRRAKVLTKSSVAPELIMQVSR